MFVVKTTQDRGAISGSIFNDLNNNGVRDANEPPLRGQTVYLDLDDNGQLDDGEPTAITDAEGLYYFHT